MAKTIKRPRFNKIGTLVASSNPIRVSLIHRFNIVCRYRENAVGIITHSTLTFKDKQI